MDKENKTSQEIPLSIEVIESFGFTHLPKKSLKGMTERFEWEQYHERIHPDVSYMYWHLYIKYYPDRNTITVTADISDGTEGEKFFEGIIRYKSEFITLLRFLNINQNNQ